MRELTLPLSTYHEKTHTRYYQPRNSTYHTKRNLKLQANSLNLRFVKASENLYKPQKINHLTRREVILFANRASF